MQSNLTEIVRLNPYFKNEYRTILLCIDSYEDKTIAGRLYNPYFENVRYFKNAIQFLMIAEELFDKTAFPQSFTVARKFWDNKTINGDNKYDTPQDELPPQQGKMASFLLKVVFRQNSIWQGSLSWVGQNKEESFRSVLELIKILDNALCTGNAS